MILGLRDSSMYICFDVCWFDSRSGVCDFVGGVSFGFNLIPFICVEWVSSSSFIVYFCVVCNSFVFCW